MSARAPAFQFYPGDFLADLNVMCMTLEELGAYWKLVSVCWIEGSLPAEMPRLARILGVAERKMLSLWSAIGPCFDAREDGRLDHPRLERERSKQAASSLARAANARKRWHAGEDANASRLHADSSASAHANRCPPSSTSSSTAVTPPVGPPEGDEPKATPKRNRGTTLPSDFALTEERQGYALQRGIADPADAFGAFSDHHTARGSVFKDWDAAWRTWCRNARRFSGGGSGSSVVLVAPGPELDLTGSAAAVQDADRQREALASTERRRAFAAEMDAALLELPAAPALRQQAEREFDRRMPGRERAVAARLRELVAEHLGRQAPGEAV
jgi:uncharacterized protein YdaU (DUF1376 family)